MNQMENPSRRFLLSVIVPIYKVEPYIRQCIGSLINQTYQNIEIILVDDGSPDSCPAICDEFALKNKNIRVIHKPNGGLVSARKAGFAASCGQYISFVDGDDWVETDFYEKVTEVLEKIHPDIFAATSFFKAKENTVERVTVENYIGLYDRNALENQVFKKLICASAPPFDFGFTPSLWSKVIRRELVAMFLPEEPEDISLGEDLAVTLPCMLKANTVYFSEICGYYYRQISSSITHTFDTSSPERMNTLLCFLNEKTADYKSYGIETQLSLYGINMLKNILILLVRESDNYRRDLSKFRPLFQNELIKQALKMHLPFKDKFLIKAAKAKLTVILKFFKKRWINN